VRLRRGLTQSALAELAGVHRTEIGLLEKGRRNARLDTIVMLAAALGSDPAELVLGLIPSKTQPSGSQPCYQAADRR
jgi:transcriptional regulator with XRE-family HTH domain